MAGDLSSLARVSPAQFRHARVALLSTWHPEPVDNGRKQRTRMIIDALSPLVEIVLISLIDEPLENDCTLPKVPGVTAQYVLPFPEFRSRSIRGLISAVSGKPRSINATWSDDVSSRINRIVSEHQADVAIGTDLRTLQYLTALPPGVRRILDEPDVSPFLGGANRPGGAAYARAMVREWKYRRLLRRAMPRLDSVVVASNAELDAFERLSGHGATVIENGVPALPECLWSPSESSILLFTGSITYQPNLEGVRFFLDRVLPVVELWAPRVKLQVTGRLPERPPPEMRHRRVEFTGRLSSLDHLYRNARLFVLPLQFGTGTRIKLLEAMSYGMPIVSTRKGAEGLPVVDGEHLLFADDAATFAGAILKLMSDAELCARLGSNARALVAERFTGPIIDEAWRGFVATALAESTSGMSNG
jgi:glycosyltransferase involved in cell wall biosynthesis